MALLYVASSVDAECLAVQALMKFSNFAFKLREWDVPESSPSGEMPFLRLADNTLLVSQEIYAEIRLKAADLNKSLTTVQQADHDAYTCLILHKIRPAWLFALWCEPENYDQVTRAVHSRRLSFPLNYVVPMRKRWQISERLSSLRTVLDPEDLYDDASQAIAALAEALGNKPFFFGEKPTEIDAQFFGYLHAILHTSIPINELRACVTTYPELVSYAERLAGTVFAHSSSS